MAARAGALPGTRTIRDERRRVAIVVFTYAALLVTGVVFSIPFLWTVSSSLKTAPEMHVFPPQLLPDVPQWTNYAKVWTTQPVARWIANSLLIILLSVPGAVLTGSLTAFAF